MADALAGIFLLLAIIAFLAGFVGLVKPSLIRQSSKVKAFGKSMLASLVLFIACIIIIPKNQDVKQEMTITAVSKEKSVLPQSEKNIKIQVKDTSFDISHIIDTKGFVSFKGESNLPSGIELYLSLRNESGNSLGATSVKINNGSFITKKFSKDGIPHLAGNYKLYVAESSSDFSLEGKKLFQPFEYQFTIHRTKVTPKELTKKQKLDILQLFENIIEQVKIKRDDIQHYLRKNQSIGYSEDDAAYLAKWNRDVRRWEKELKRNHEKTLGKRMNAPYCPVADFHVRLAANWLKLLGIKYVFGDAHTQEKSLAESISDAEKEINECKIKLRYD